MSDSLGLQYSSTSESRSKVDALESSLHLWVPDRPGLESLHFMKEMMSIKRASSAEGRVESIYNTTDAYLYMKVI